MFAIVVCQWHQPTHPMLPKPRSPLLRLPLSPRSQIRSPPPDARRIAAFGADKGEEEEADQTSGAGRPEVNGHAFRDQPFRIPGLSTNLEAPADPLKYFQQQFTRRIVCRIEVWTPEPETNAVEDDEAG